MSFPEVYQNLLPLLRERLRGEIETMGSMANKPMEITDAVLNDIAVTFAMGILSGGDVADSFAAAYHAVFTLQNEH